MAKDKINPETWYLNSTKKFIDRKGYTVTDKYDNIVCDVNMDHPDWEENARTIRVAKKMKSSLEYIKRRLEPLLPETILSDIVDACNKGLKDY